MSVRTVALTIEYDGTGLAGWQRQANAPSVQQLVEEALAAMIGAPTTVIGASRTDAGVHARGQVAHFHTASAIPLRGFVRGLTGLLPPAVAVVDAREAPPGFHARFSARGKRYRYAVLARPAPSPLDRHRAWHRPQPLDLDAMRRAAAHLVGEHDFSSFRAAGCSARTATRAIAAVDIRRGAGDVVDIEVVGNAFLRNMVRIVAGTLVEVGQGRRAPEQMPAVLAARDRAAAGQTAPAHGLTLMQVFYVETVAGGEPHRGGPGRT